MDGRRHSVDIPISKTLVALRRVRSLRDPSTNSMSKFPTLVDNVHWESGPGNGVSLRFFESCHEGVSRANNQGVYGPRNSSVAKHELLFHEGKSKLNTWGRNIAISPRAEQVDELEYSGSSQENDTNNESVSESYSINRVDKGLDLACIVPSSKKLENGDSYHEPCVGSSHLERMEHTSYNRKLFCDKPNVGGARSHACCAPSISDTLSPNTASMFANEDDLVPYDHNGYGVTCCWLKTPRFKDSNVSSDVEDRPLIPKDVDETAMYGRSIQQHNGSQTLETPRSLQSKFRPKSFSDLVGQNMVARSLLSAITKERISSFYIFYGPRGTGKTSASRIFAAALNCLSLDEYRPCCLCRECKLFFSGRSKDVKEVDSVRINSRDRIKSLVKNASMVPTSSRFKVFILDECQLLHGETWATLLNSLENLPQNVVFLMITPDLDSVPRSALSRAQKYHFPKIKDVDIASRLGKICTEEGIDFDKEALDFIAAKANGSLRDAEMMLDQLSLLGRKITVSLVHELTGVVSDDELLDLLDLSLSSDTSNTVIRARELMRSRIDPVQLISQLANLIMDILAGKYQNGGSEAGSRFFMRHNSEVDMLKLSHALRILSETEKQLRVSKNQSTWFTAALLQLSSMEYSSIDINDAKSCLRTSCDVGADLCRSISAGKRSSHLGLSCCVDKSHRLGMLEDCKGTLESIWNRATELCEPKALKHFLRKRGKLAYLYVNEGVTVAELEFRHRDYVSKAEKSWKLIASSLQSILGCNIEIRVNLAPCKSDSNSYKAWRPSFKFFSCSRRLQHQSSSTHEKRSVCEYFNNSSQKPMIGRPSTCFTDRECYGISDSVRTLRNSDGNSLSSGKATWHQSFGEDPMTSVLAVESSKDVNIEALTQESDRQLQPYCFPRSFWCYKNFHAVNSTQRIGSATELGKESVWSGPRYPDSEAYSCTNNPYASCPSSDNCTKATRDDDSQKEDSDLLCWRTPTLSSKKPGHEQQKSHLVGWVLPCASAR